MNRRVPAAIAAAVAGAIVASAAPGASAEPSLGSVRTAATAGRLAVTVPVTLGARGTVTVRGTVEGRRIRARKRARPGSAEVVLTLDPRRAKVRRADGPLDFDLTVSATERGGPRAEQHVTATVGVPLVLLPGFGNERTPGAFDAFAAALDAAAGNAWGAVGAAPRVVVHGYDSTLPLAETTAGLDAAVRKLLRGSVFRRVDVVGHSMGGLVARQWMTAGGRGRVRKVAFLGTPHEGAPVATLALVAARTGALDALLASAGGVDLSQFGVADLVGEDTIGALEVFTPTYDWATVFGTPFRLEILGGVTEPPLAALNDRGPDAALDEIHAFAYTSVLPEEFGVPIGTVDVIDATTFLSLSGGIDLANVGDLAALADGDGDGVVPAHSAWMDGVTSWSASPKFTKHDLGGGTHVTFTTDARVLAGLAEVLTR